MVEIETPVVPTNFLVLNHDEAYAGTTRSDWEAITSQQGLLKTVELEDIELENRECDICRESFGSSEGGRSSETPVSLPCGHIFGKDCLSSWISVGSRHDSHGHDDDLDAGDIGPTNWNYSMPNPAEWFTTAAFDCPKCRKGFNVSASREEAPAIEARLQFWDRAYERLGIKRSAEEEACRHDLWQFVEKVKAEQKEVTSDPPPSFILRTQVSAMQFALRRAEWDLSPAQRRLRDAFFYFGCFGVNSVPEEYSAEAYENRRVPLWCWQISLVERGMPPVLGLSRKQWITDEFVRYWKKQRLGTWKRLLFGELERDESGYYWVDSRYV